MSTVGVRESAPREGRRHGWSDNDVNAASNSDGADVHANAVAATSKEAGGAEAVETDRRACVGGHGRTADEVKRCKKGHRSELKASEWGKYGYAAREDVLSEVPQFDGKQTFPIPRIKRSEVTLEEFFHKFAVPHQPCIIEGSIDEWPAMERWKFDTLLREYRQTSFKVGEDDKGRKLRMKFKYFVDYMKHQKDDSPLYLFETKCEGDAQARRILDDFTPPDLFPHDLFNLVNPQAKPPFRWWSIGPRRSGTTVHTDPLGTSAWNAVTSGRKRWVLFEPSVPARVAKGKDVINKQIEDDEAIMYFDFLLPRLKEKHPEVRVYEGIQGPGEVIFVPGNWLHGVLNIDDCVAVTQNYCGLDNFDLVWTRTRKEQKKLAYLWLRNMKKFAPHLHSRALELNRSSNYLMRHERGADHPESSDSSSSSESSTDSSSDEEEDVNLQTVYPPGVQLTPPWLSGAKEATAKSLAPPPMPALPRKRPHASRLSVDLSGTES
eukprot:TRINITY_DN9768_c0_g1_i2.p1 TRINITY_DN9768_c0_g1~~TRINITY_DN9768_c0_g1_i2.p1  ORF type:complete len:510 (+),score=87.66 TRINITY_DN9768_c0_g1_i2:56-1531(+)